MTDSLIEINKLFISLKRGGSEILKGISFCLQRGKITGIVGESGSGKSVTGLSIMGLLPPALQITSGDITYHSITETKPISITEKENSRKFRGRRFTMIFQEPMTSLNPSLRCGKQLDEALAKFSDLKSGERKKKINDLLVKVKLNDPDKITGSFPHQLSGGQRQRVMIAMALATNPELLIADEPTTALDVTVQKEIIILLKDLQEEFNLTVMFITHDLRLLSEIADEIIVMRKGEVIESGSVQEILTRAKEPYTRALLACQPPMDSRPEKLPTVEDFENGLIPEIKEFPRQKSDLPLITIRNLDLHYRMPGKPGFHALKNIDLEIFKGETLGLAGESGCGKTSLGKSILRLIDNFSGDIVYNGINLDELSKKHLKSFRRKIQVVFQDPYSSLNPRIKIGYALTEARKIHFPGETTEERYRFALNLVEKTGLHKEDMEKYPHEFSGGQRQRIGIARALAVSPEFLILDESVSALDVSVQAQILNLLNQLKKEFGLSYLFISHDIAVVRYMSDRMIVMKDGEIVEKGDPDQVCRSPKSSYTKKLMDSIPGI